MRKNSSTLKFTATTTLANHLYVIGKSLHQQEYQILKRGYEVGLSKIQVANIFRNQEVLVKVQLSPLEAIEEYTGAKRESIRANFCGDYAMIPDPSELDVVENNLLTIQVVGIIIVIAFTYRRITSDYRVKR